MSKYNIREKNPLLLSVPAICILIVGMVVKIIERRAQKFFPVRYPLGETLSDNISMNIFSVIVFVLIPLGFLVFIIKKYGTKIIVQSSPLIFLISISLSIISILQDLYYNGEFLRTGIGFIHIPSLLCFGYAFITTYLSSRFNDDARLSEFYPLLLLALTFCSVLVCCRTLSESYALIIVLSFMSSLFALIKNKSIHKRQIFSLLNGFILITSSFLLTVFIIEKLSPEMNAYNNIIEILFENRDEPDLGPSVTEYIHIFKEALKYIRTIGLSKYDINSIPSVFYFAYIGNTGLETILFGGGWLFFLIVLMLEMLIVWIIFNMSIHSENLYSKIFTTAVASMFLVRTILGTVITFAPSAYLYLSSPTLPFMGGYTSVLYDSVLFVVSLLLSTTYSCSKTGRIISCFIVVNEKLKTRIINWINADDLNDE